MTTTMVVVMVMVMVMVMVGLVLNSQYVTYDGYEYDWTNYGKNGVKSEVVKISGFAFSKKYKDAIKAFEENEKKKYNEFLIDSENRVRAYENRIRNSKLNSPLIKSKKLTGDYEIDVIIKRYNNGMLKLIENSNVLASDLKYFVWEYEDGFKRDVKKLEENRKNHEFLMQFYA